MNASRITRTTTRRTVVAVAAVVAATGLVACGTEKATDVQTGNRPALNPMEHEAHRQLPDILKKQSEALNPREHLAHRDADEVVPRADRGDLLARLPR